MTPLRAPLRDLLRRPVDDVAARRLWQRVRDGRRPAARQRPWLVAAAAAVALVVTLVVVGRGGWGDAAPGPLALDADRMVLEVDAGRAPLRVVASDGSTITVEPSSRVEVVENTDRTFGTLVSRGRARFEVQPGGPRRWTVDCGPFVVEVVGTAFVVERDATTARVAVERGEVVVRGEAVPDRVVHLVAGKELAITTDADARRRSPGERRGDDDDVASAPPPPSVATAVVDPPAAGAPTSTPATRPGPTTHEGRAPAAASSGASAGSSAAPGASTVLPAAPWQDLAREGRHRDAWAALGSDGFRRATGGGSVDELLALADVARLSGHPSEAVLPLERVLREHGGDGRASLAALTLGRLQLDALGQPAAAAASLNRAIAAGLPGGLAEDALARRVEAYARAGDRDAAVAAYAELARRFPSSPRLDGARRWTEPPP